MPIVDYKKRALRAENQLMENPDIPEQTKRILQRFLTAYDVSDARKNIFLHKIRPRLVEFHPIESALMERDQINALFSRLRQQYRPATYATYVNVTRRFLSWLGDGGRPASMRDIKPGKASSKKRDLEPEDMLTWGDGMLISDVLCNIQPGLPRYGEVVLRSIMQSVGPGFTGNCIDYSGRNFYGKRISTSAKVDPHGLRLIHRHHDAVRPFSQRGFPCGVPDPWRLEAGQPRSSRWMGTPLVSNQSGGSARPLSGFRRRPLSSI